MVKGYDNGKLIWREKTKFYRSGAALSRLRFGSDASGTNVGPPPINELTGGIFTVIYLDSRVVWAFYRDSTGKIKRIANGRFY